jgi:hypothetical protein
MINHNFMGMKPLIGMSAKSGKFGVIPDPPEPPSDKWFEEHCPRCKYNHEYEENGKIYAECTEGGCTGFVEREDEE